MHVLIAMKNPRDAKRLSKILGGLGHTLDVAASPAETEAHLRRRRPDVAVLSSAHDSWLHPLDAQPGHHIYRIALLNDLDPTSATRAWNAGFDDVARKCACPEELAGRVAALDRIRTWVGTMGEAFGADGFDILASESIIGLGDTLAEEFGAMIGGSLTATRAIKLPEIAFAAEVPLTLASDSKEVSIGIGVLAGSTDAFGELLFGESVGREIMFDAMREFANTAGGALKRTALEQHKTYSLGLPVDCVFPSAPSGTPIWQVKGSGIELVVWAAAVDDKPKRISAGMLTEGMVLTQPVMNGSGMLLVQAGAVLTQNTVQRLLELIGPNTLVEVARAA